MKQKKDETHTEYLFIPVDCLPKGHSENTMLYSINQMLSEGENIETMLSNFGFDNRRMIRISYEVPGPDPDDES